jgi:hypothetical protein
MIAPIKARRVMEIFVWEDQRDPNVPRAVHFTKPNPLVLDHVTAFIRGCNCGAAPDRPTRAIRL